LSQFFVIIWFEADNLMLMMFIGSRADRNPYSNKVYQIKNNMGSNPI
jgi:hypothetical protein